MPIATTILVQRNLACVFSGDDQQIRARKVQLGDGEKLYEFLMKEMATFPASKDSGRPRFVLKRNAHNKSVVKAYASASPLLNEFFRKHSSDESYTIIQEYVDSRGDQASTFRVVQYPSRAETFSVSHGSSLRKAPVNTAAAAPNSSEKSLPGSGIGSQEGKLLSQHRKPPVVTRVREGAPQNMEKYAKELFAVLQRFVFAPSGLDLESAAFDFVQHRTGE